MWWEEKSGRRRWDEKGWRPIWWGKVEWGPLGSDEDFGCFLSQLDPSEEARHYQCKARGRVRSWELALRWLSWVSPLHWRCCAGEAVQPRTAWSVDLAPALCRSTGTCWAPAMRQNHLVDWTTSSSFNRLQLSHFLVLSLILKKWWWGLGGRKPSPWCVSSPHPLQFPRVTHLVTKLFTACLLPFMGFVTRSIVGHHKDLEEGFLCHPGEGSRIPRHAFGSECWLCNAKHSV